MGVSRVKWKLVWLLQSTHRKGRVITTEEKVIIVSSLPLSHFNNSVTPVPSLMATWRSALGRKFAWRRPWRVSCLEQRTIVCCSRAVTHWEHYPVLCMYGMGRGLGYESGLWVLLLCRSWSRTQWGKCRDPRTHQDFSFSCWAEEPVSLVLPPHTARWLVPVLAPSLLPAFFKNQNDDKNHLATLRIHCLILYPFLH